MQQNHKYPSTPRFAGFFAGTTSGGDDTLPQVVEIQTRFTGQRRFFYDTHVDLLHEDLQALASSSDTEGSF